MRASILVGERTRHYTVAGPEQAPPGRALVLAFHGSRQTGETHRAFTGRALDDLAERGEAVVAYLDGFRGNWNDARRESAFPARIEGIDDVAFTRAVIDALVASHGVDRGRVLAMGFSNGGQFVLRLLHETPGLIAGAAIVGATMPVPESFLIPPAEPAGDVPPVVLVHGTRDPIVPFEGGRMRAWARAAFRVGGRTLSARGTAEYLARRAGIVTPSVRDDLRGVSRGTRLERIAFRQEGRSPVTLYVVHGGGHTVPGPVPAPRILGRTSGAMSLADLARELLAAEGGRSRSQETGESRSSSS